MSPSTANEDIPGPPSMPQTEKKRPPPTPGKCSFFLEVKSRYCRFSVAPGSDRCGAHKEVETGEANPEKPVDLKNQRIVCPLDSSHTVYASKLQWHLKVCSKKRQDEILVRQPFYKHHVNLPDHADLGTSVDLAAADADREDGAEPPSAPDLAKEAEGSALTAFLARLEAAYQSAAAEVLSPSFTSEDILEKSLLETPGVLQHAEKHEVQNAALTDLIMEKNLDVGDPLVVEYGCGRAGLAAALLKKRPDLRCLLLDRDARRHKLENVKEHRGQETLRLKLDIADFDLGDMLGAPLKDDELPTRESLECTALQASSSTPSGHVGPLEGLMLQWKAAQSLQKSRGEWPPQRMLACAKHLCGGATDIALRSMAIGAVRETGPNGFKVLPGVCIATCCHHRCDPVSYVNVEFLKRHGLSMEPPGYDDFAYLKSLAGWAVGGRSGVSTERLRETRRYGLMAKRLLDLGRVSWMRTELGMQDASFAHYVDKTVTPENFALVAGSSSEEAS